MLFAGAFQQDFDADNGVRPWSCPLCSTVNSAVIDDSEPRCMTCKRLRSPSWLCLEDSGEQVLTSYLLLTLLGNDSVSGILNDLQWQITLGSYVFHTSVGGSKSVSVVVAINYVLKGVTLLRVKAKHSDGSQLGEVTFHEVVLNALQIQQQLESLDAEGEEESCVLDNYGICGECRGVFRVVQGDRQSQYANEDKVAVLEKELQQLDEQKLQLVREKSYERVLECSEEIKLRTKELQVSKRDLEFLTPIFCPFCGCDSAKQNN